MPQLTKDTRVLKDPVTGELIAVPAAEADKRAADEGLSYATLPEIDTFNEREKFGSAGQTAIGALELAGESATLGLYAPSSVEASSRRKVLRREHPGIAMGAEVAGALPAIAAAEATGGLAAAAGASARLAQAASVIAEGGVSGFAQEQVQAREEGRDIDAGNVFLYGIGGEIAGRVIPKAAGAGLRRAAQGVEDVLGGQTDNVLVRAEQRAGQAGSDVAKAPPGPERDRFLRDNAPKIVDDATEALTDRMNKASSEFQDLGDLSKKRAKIKNLVSREHVGQDNWVVEQVDRLQIMREEVGAFADTPGLAGMAKKLGQAIDDAEGKITGSRQAADRFIAADQIKRTFQRYHVALGRSKMTAQDAVYHDQMMSIVDSVQEGLRRGLEDESLWGRAARFQADVNSAWHNRWFQGAPVTEADLARVVGKEFDAKPIIEFDPAKVRSFLQKDKIGRGLTEDKLRQVLEGYQEMAEAHRKWGMSDAKKLDEIQSAVADIRKAIDTADEVNAARPRADAQDAADRASDQLIRDVVPVLGGPLVAARRMLRNIDTAGKAHIGSAASMMVNGTRRVANAATAVGGKAAPVATVAAGHLLRERTPVEDRFRGTYPTLTQSFLAKRDNIVAAMQEPDQLANAMADSLGDLAEAAPDLHLRVVMRMSEGFNYLSQHMPPGIEQSLLSKHASPPDVQAIKEFARLWEAVMDPGAVVQDFATMHATPSQARAIEAVHPDIYARLQNDAIAAVADSPVRPPYERLRYLNQMFKLGPALGGVWKPSVAKNIKNSMSTAPANPEGLSSGTLETSPSNPRGIASIAAGPTSAG
jgi:hypothetical protein